MTVFVSKARRGASEMQNEFDKEHRPANLVDSNDAGWLLRLPSWIRRLHTVCFAMLVIAVGAFTLVGAFALTTLLRKIGIEHVDATLLVLPGVFLLAFTVIGAKAWVDWPFRQWLRHRTAKETDFGRSHGWFIERDGKRIGKLDYLYWDDYMQFWHVYRVTWRSPADEVVGADAWITAGLVLRNRHYTDFVARGFITSGAPGSNEISVRSAYVPVELLC